MEGTASQDSGQEGTKKCPSCAEVIKAEALVCRFCGFDFRTQSHSVRTTATAAVAATKTNGMAIASMVLGILWIYWIGSVLALVFGYTAKKQIDQSAGQESGRGMAIAGIVLGWVGAGTLLIVIVVIAIGAAAAAAR